MSRKAEPRTRAERQSRKVEPSARAPLDSSVPFRVLVSRRLFLIVPEGTDSSQHIASRSNLQRCLLLLHRGREPSGFDPPSASGFDPPSGGFDHSDEEATVEPIPFELAALEAMLMTACSELHRQQVHPTAKHSYNSYGHN